MAGLGTVFAVLILYFGVFRRTSAPMAAPAPMPAPALQEAASGAAEDSAAPAEEEAAAYSEISDENEVNSFMATQDSVPRADAKSSGTRIIIGKEAEDIDPDSYGEKHVIEILDTEVSVYGNRAAVFACGGETVAVISAEELSEEEMTILITNITRDFGN
jgi:hypothetical protein